MFIPHLRALLSASSSSLGLQKTTQELRMTSRAPRVVIDDEFFLPGFETSSVQYFVYL